MASSPKKPKLNNKFTHFGAFTWRDNDKLRRALQEAREKFWPLPLPDRFKVKL